MLRKSLFLVALAGLLAGAAYFFFKQTGNTRPAARRGFVSTNGARFVIDLPDLGGSRALAEAGVDAVSLMAFEGD